MTTAEILEMLKQCREILESRRPVDGAFTHSEDVRASASRTIKKMLYLISPEYGL